MIYVYMGAAILFLASNIGTYFYGNSVGKDIATVEWQAEKIKIQKGHQAELEKAMQHAYDVKTAWNKTLIEVINEANERNENLERDIVDLNSKRMYVTTKTKPCDSVPGKTEGAGQFDRAASRVELSDEIARNIRRDYIDAQRVVNQYEACRAALIELVDVVE